ncbi:amidohydrolase family protein [Massilia glaciei]|uniref:Amidohydrolase n=1 Tax=Massilia glaciei TaxID=1524097 RepID=A0A2U2HJ13_9BURK|nr:amidohydrolase family protein [Massilia glaciei]PWF46740.1 amidohydrolase [Massilia glaciei]
MHLLKPTALIGAMLLSFAAHAATQTTRYIITVDNGTKAGEQVVERDDDGLTRVRYIFKDNGRGPELKEEFRLAADGTLDHYKVSGNSTFGAVVDEQFSRRGGQADWRSTSEKGGSQQGAGAFYAPLSGSFEPLSLSIGALAARADGKLPLLPSGTLTQRKLDQLEVGAQGKTRTLQLLAQTGIGLTPVFVWATTDARPRMFAVVIPGYLTIIEDGWQANAEALAARQKVAENKMLGELAARLQHRLPGLTVVRNARVFDSERARLGAPSDVYVLRGSIMAVLPAGAPGSKADQEIDAAGRVMLPGLFDMHGHAGRWEGGLNLAAGVTTVRDMGNDNTQLQQMLDENAAGKLLGPRVVPAGFLEGKSPYSANNGFVVSDMAGARSAIDWYAGHGYPQLKIYNSFPPALVRETVAYAHSRGMRVSGHVPAGLRAQDVVDMGYDELQHINQLMLNFLVTPKTDTRTLERFVLPADKVAGLDFGSKPVRNFIASLKKKGVVVDPTLATFSFLKQKDGDMAAEYASVAEHMPPDVKRSFHVGTMKIPDEAAARRYAASYDKMVEFVGLLHKAGVPLVAGTDALAGFTLHSELELYVKAGLTPSEALQVATRNGARYTRTSHERGSIAPGKLADLVLVDGDPTVNISDVRKVALVLTRGYLVYPHEIDVALGIKPFVSNPPLLRHSAAGASPSP